MEKAKTETATPLYQRGQPGDSYIERGTPAFTPKYGFRMVIDSNGVGRIKPVVLSDPKKEKDIKKPKAKKI